MTCVISLTSSQRGIVFQGLDFLDYTPGISVTPGTDGDVEILDLKLMLQRDEIPGELERRVRFACARTPVTEALRKSLGWHPINALCSPLPLRVGGACGLLLTERLCCG